MSSDRTDAEQVRPATEQIRPVPVPRPAPPDRVAPPPGPGAPPSGRPAGTAPRPVTGLAVADAWSRLLAYLLVATMVGSTVMMPIAGLVLALTGAVALWSAEAFARAPGPAGAEPARPRASRSLRILAGVVPTLPYAAVVCVLVTLAALSLAAAGPVVDPLAAGSWGAGAAAYVLWAGPGVRPPRRRLARLAGAVTSSQRLLGAAGAALGSLAVLAMVGAVSLKPSYAPMYALQNSLQTTLGHLQWALAHRLR